MLLIPALLAQAASWAVGPPWQPPQLLTLLLLLQPLPRGQLADAARAAVHTRMAPLAVAAAEAAGVVERQGVGRAVGAAVAVAAHHLTPPPLPQLVLLLRRQLGPPLDLGPYCLESLAAQLLPLRPPLLPLLPQLRVLPSRPLGGKRRLGKRAATGGGAGSAEAGQAAEVAANGAACVHLSSAPSMRTGTHIAAPAAAVGGRAGRQSGKRAGGWAGRGRTCRANSGSMTRGAKPAGKSPAASRMALLGSADDVAACWYVWAAAAAAAAAWLASPSGCTLAPCCHGASTWRCCCGCCCGDSC